MSKMKKFRRGKGGTWYVRFGRGVERSLGTSDEEVANKLIADLEYEKAKNNLHIVGKKELRPLSVFVSEYLSTRKSMAPNTYRADKLALAKFSEFYGESKSLGAINAKTLDQFRAWLKSEGGVIMNRSTRKVTGRTSLMNSSCNTNIKHLKIALKTAIKWDYIKARIDLRDDLKQYRVDQRKAVFMSREEVGKLLGIAGADPLMKAPIAIQVFCGCSRAEVMGQFHFTPTHIEYKRVKTGKLVRVPISEGLRPYISYLREGLQYIVPWKNPRTYSDKFSEVVEKASIAGISPHKVRHTFATHMLQEGADLKTISELLGHSSIHITAEFYAHISDEQKRKAVNLLSYDAPSPAVKLQAVNSNSRKIKNKK